LPTRTHGRNAKDEKSAYLALTASALKKFVIDDGVRGRRLDMALMFADSKIREEFPIATLIYESKGASQITEAHEERVFRFAKATKSPQRTRLSPIILGAYVIIKHNIPFWEELEGLDYGLLWNIFKKTKNETGSHSKPGDDDTSDDDEASDDSAEPVESAADD
jgi:hypothetical protein